MANSYINSINLNFKILFSTKKKICVAGFCESQDIFLRYSQTFLVGVQIRKKIEH
jgi:hypothetical protein